MSRGDRNNSETSRDEAEMPSVQYAKIEAYVRKQFEKGKSEKEVKKSLLSAGWPKAMVADIISSVRQNRSSAPLQARQAQDDNHEDALIKINNISKSFGQKKVLNSINLNIKPGEVFGIIGLSGSGKTTLLNSIVGFLEPDEGEILYLCDLPKGNRKHISVTTGSDHVKRAFGFATQDPSFYSRLTAEENLDHFGSLYKMKKKDRKQNIEKLLALTELLDSKKTLAGNLSGGMQKRLGVACSLIHNPKVIIMDEPTADLDPFLRKEMWHLIKKINSEGTTVILTSHFLSEIEHLCHRVAILHDSNIVALGTPEDLKDSYSHNEEVHLEIESQRYGPVIKALQSRNVHIDKISNQDHKIVIYTRQPDQVLHELLHIIKETGDKIVDVDLNKPSLSEVFESFVNKKIAHDI